MVEQLVGKKILKVTGLQEDSAELILELEGGFEITLGTYNDLWSGVRIESVNGVRDLVGSTFYSLIEQHGIPEPKGYIYSYDSHTWTSYILETSKGRTGIRWLGESNGFYSENGYCICELKENFSKL